MSRVRVFSLIGACSMGLAASSPVLLTAVALSLLVAPVQAAPAASPALCQSLIRANYPATEADQTITVTFLSFVMSGVKAHEAVYANDLIGARGHTVMATPIHTKYTVLTHFQDPYADDQLRTYDAQYLCYQSAKGGWVVEMVSRLPGGETAQYIKKR